jgi:hypothetical protein
MDQICRIVEGHHGNTLLVIQIPYSVSKVALFPCLLE